MTNPAQPKSMSLSDRRQGSTNESIVSGHSSRRRAKPTSTSFFAATICSCCSHGSIGRENSESFSIGALAARKQRAASLRNPSRLAISPTMFGGLQWPVCDFGSLAWASIDSAIESRSVSSISPACDTPEVKRHRPEQIERCLNELKVVPSPASVAKQRRCRMPQRKPHVARRECYQSRVAIRSSTSASS